MNEISPSDPGSGLEGFAEEMSVEEVAQMDTFGVEEHETENAASAGSPAAAAVAEDVAAVTIPGLSPAPLPIPPMLPRYRNVSGRYRSCRTTWQLELRVDVDGFRPMKKISGDFFHTSGSTVSYYGSFIIDAPSVTVSSTQVTIIGTANTTWTTSYNKIRVSIPRHTIFQQAANAHVQFMTADNRKGSAYTCLYESRYFRTVQLEEDREAGVTAFDSYNTGSLPSGGTARTLDVAKSYAEAGVQMQIAGETNVIPTAEAGADTLWSNAELHNAMVKHFSLWKDEPQWKVWLFHAMRHEYGPGLRGIMFDQQGKQRQGCASFYQIIGGNTATKLRDQLYVCVHELGHCFNLYHSFHKKYMNPPQPNRPSSLSWMNYPGKYTGGRAAFWSGFAFQFDNQEVIHLRHAFRDNIIMGGNPFGTGAALTDNTAFADLVEDNSGIKLELEVSKSYAYGEPVVSEIKLYRSDSRSVRVHKDIHPNLGFVQVAVQRPSGEVIQYKPLMEHCVDVEITRLDDDQPSIYASAYIGYDKEKGHIFDQPGIYTLRGVYYALDGSTVLSEATRMRVRPPMNDEDEKVAGLMMGDEQGQLLYLLGSDSEFLQKGNDALDTILVEHGEHPLALYARMVKGCNAAREFKTIGDDQKVECRDPDTDTAISMLTSVNEASEEEGVDNITLNMTMQTLARAQIKAGDKSSARKTITRIGTVFRKKGLKPHVDKLIKGQQEALRALL